MHQQAGPDVCSTFRASLHLHHKAGNRCCATSGGGCLQDRDISNHPCTKEMSSPPPRHTGGAQILDRSLFVQRRGQEPLLALELHTWSFSPTSALPSFTSNCLQALSQHRVFWQNYSQCLLWLLLQPQHKVHTKHRASFQTHLCPAVRRDHYQPRLLLNCQNNAWFSHRSATQAKATARL